MSRGLLVLNGASEREKAVLWVHASPPGTRVEFKRPRRTLPQNDRMWAMLTDVATQVKWHGQRLTPSDWKLIFLDGLKREMRTTENLDGDGMVSLIGTSSSDLSKEEMTDLIELIFAWGANHGVTFHEKEKAA